MSQNYELRLIQQIINTSILYQENYFLKLHTWYILQLHLNLVIKQNYL